MTVSRLTIRIREPARYMSCTSRARNSIGPVVGKFMTTATIISPSSFAARSNTPRLNVPPSQHVPSPIAASIRGKSVTAGLRPENLEIDRSGDALHVDLVESLGGVSFAYLVADTGEKIVIEERGDERVSAGQRVGLKFDYSRLYLFDAETEQRLR